MKKIDCPLCKAKNVISITDIKRVFTPRPGPKRVIGNYGISYNGGEYDFSHAKRCPKLKKVEDKESLLEYFVTEGNPAILKNSLFSYKDYKKLLFDVGCEFQIEPIEVESKNTLPVLEDPTTWKFHISITSRIVPSQARAILTEGESIPQAFQRMQHRLLCGEIIDIGPGFQFKIENSKRGSPPRLSLGQIRK